MTRRKVGSLITQITETDDRDRHFYPHLFRTADATTAAEAQGRFASSCKRIARSQAPTRHRRALQSRK